MYISYSIDYTENYKLYNSIEVEIYGEILIMV